MPASAAVGIVEELEGDENGRRAGGVWSAASDFLADAAPKFGGQLRLCSSCENLAEILVKCSCLA